LLDERRLWGTGHTLPLFHLLTALPSSYV